MSQTFGSSVHVQKWGSPNAIAAKNLNRGSHQPQFIRMAETSYKRGTVYMTQRSRPVVANKKAAFGLSQIVSPILVFPFVVAKQFFGYIIELINKAAAPFAKAEDKSLEETVFDLNHSMGYHWRPFSPTFKEPPQAKSKPVVNSSIVDSVKETLQTLADDSINLDEIDSNHISGLDDIYPENTVQSIFTDSDIDLPRIEKKPVVPQKPTQMDELEIRIEAYKKAMENPQPPVEKVDRNYQQEKFNFATMPQVQTRVEEINKAARRALAKEAGMVPLSQMSELFTKAVQQKTEIKHHLSKNITAFNTQKKNATPPKTVKYPAQNPGVAYAAGIDEETSGMILNALAKTNQSLSSSINNIVTQYFAEA